MTMFIAIAQIYGYYYFYFYVYDYKLDISWFCYFFMYGNIIPLEQYFKMQIVVNVAFVQKTNFWPTVLI